MDATEFELILERAALKAAKEFGKDIVVEQSWSWIVVVMSVPCNSYFIVNSYPILDF